MLFKGFLLFVAKPTALIFGSLKIALELVVGMMIQHQRVDKSQKNSETPKSF